MKSHVFIGYDEREKDPFNVCVQSLKETSARPDDIIVHPLFHRDLRAAGYFDRPWEITPDGNYKDIRDGRPFSVQFSHSRFLTPFLAKQMNLMDALFVDCDFLFMEDVHKLFDEARGHKTAHPVQVVKHDYKPQNATKMDGSIQSTYNKKLWSAMMYFNLSDSAVRRLTPDIVNNAPGSFLHSFEWLGGDHRIGSINPAWHHVAGHSGGEPKAVHYTEGGPWFTKYQDCPYAKEWYASFYRYIQQKVPR